MSLFRGALALTALLTLTSAHGGHDSPSVSPNADWGTRHMAEEHHVDEFEPGAFFSLHDFDMSGFWSPNEIQRFYGLDHDSNKHVSLEKRAEVSNQIMKLIDTNNDGKIDLEEFLTFSKNGGKMPDLGTGPGHHGDDEYEYEIHHFEKYHGEDAREEDLTHPEDIEHFKKHDQEYLAELDQEKLDSMPIVESNIPAKFRRT